MFGRWNNTDRQGGRSHWRFWLLLAALVLFGRMFQAGVLWAEESLPLAVAQQMLAGQALYRDIWFDKPPLVAWFYVGVRRVAGYSGYGLRLTGVLYILAVAVVGYGLARRLWGEPEARWTAFFLAFFTGFYHPAATVPLAADLLLVLPHLAVLYFVAAGRPWAAGLVAGLAFHLNGKAVFVLAAAAGWILLSRAGRGRVVPLSAGFLLSVGAGLGLVAVGGGWSGYLEQVWRWGSSYAGAPFSERPWALGFERTLHYLGFHAALVIGAAAFWREPDRQRWPMALWLAASFAAVGAGARFFPRYYFQLLPPLAAAAGAGWVVRPRRWYWTALLAATLAVPAVRFGRANLWLALGRDWEWRDTAMDADSRRAAAAVARWSRPTEKIFVWGFRPEIYYYAQRTGASRFLESQPLTGVLADRHLERADPFLPEWALRHRRELARQLGDAPPAVIVDGLGPYNPRLAIENYPELRPLLDRYRLVEQTAGTRVYVRRPTEAAGNTPCGRASSRWRLSG